MCCFWGHHDRQQDEHLDPMCRPRASASQLSLQQFLLLWNQALPCGVLWSEPSHHLRPDFWGGQEPGVLNKASSGEDSELSTT